MSLPTLVFPLKGYIKEGDTIAEKTFIFHSPYNGDLTTATIKLCVKNGTRTIYNVSNGNGITVIDSNTFKIDEIPSNTFPADTTLIGDLEITEANGFKKTYCNIQYVVIKDYTK